jgi:hypothetical protein
MLLEAESVRSTGLEEVFPSLVVVEWVEAEVVIVYCIGGLGL